MKQEKTESVLHEWVHTLPFTQQALLLLSLRGPDGIPKHSGAKRMLYYIRGLVLKPAYPDYIGFDGFMKTTYVDFTQDASTFFADVDTYPMHFLMHLYHAAEVIGYGHPNKEIREYWTAFYITACESLHMNEETPDELNSRLFY